MRAGFLALAKEFPGRCRVIDGDRAPGAVAEDVAVIARKSLAWTARA